MYSNQVLVFLGGTPRLSSRSTQVSLSRTRAKMKSGSPSFIGVFPMFPLKRMPTHHKVT